MYRNLPIGVKIWYLGGLKDLQDKMQQLLDCAYSYDGLTDEEKAELIEAHELLASDLHQLEHETEPELPF